MIETLSFENITLAHPGQAPLFSDVSFQFPLNQVIWIRGPNGSGKSSLLRVLGNILMPQSGQYCVNQKNILGLPFEELVVYRRKIGYSFDSGGLLANKTILENLLLPLFYHRTLSEKESLLRVENYCERFRLNDVKNLHPSETSSGLRKICVVLRSLVLNPELLLLDEPTAGIDEQAKITLLETIEQHQRDLGLKHIFISSEDHNFVKNFNYHTLCISNRGLHHGGNL